MAIQMLLGWYAGQQPKSKRVEGKPHFYQMLEARLDERRAREFMTTLRQRRTDAADFASNDLGLSHTGILREHFLQELDDNKDFLVGSGGCRLLDDSNTYVDSLEKDGADFHNTESALIFHSGYEANVAIFGTVILGIDVIVYDELIHASTHVGMRSSRSTMKFSFAQNDLESFETVLLKVKKIDPALESRRRSVLIAIETVYSMGGDIAPCKSLFECILSERR